MDAVLHHQDLHHHDFLDVFQPRHGGLMPMFLETSGEPGDEEGMDLPPGSEFLRGIRRPADLHRVLRGRSRAEAMLRHAMGRSRLARQNAIRRPGTSSTANAANFWHPLLDFSGAGLQERTQGWAFPSFLFLFLFLCSVTLVLF
jgi:hypothetical protein